MNKIIARIKGGLGNQLFCYAAARRLALVNDAELVIDDVSGFVRDRLYERQYALDNFSIPARKATPAERLEPFERYRRGFIKCLSRRRPFTQRAYLEQEGIDFDDRILAMKVKGTLYLEGYWQSELYFKDVEQIIRDDLWITPPTDLRNQLMAEEICNCVAVALHIRLFDRPDSSALHNVSIDYYQRAIAMMEDKLESPRYFLFSDDVEVARTYLYLPEDRVTFVSHNRGDENAYVDMWLMGQCQHFITANSTFSWWGAWLGNGKNKIVVSPDVEIVGIGSWGFKGLIPNEWNRV
jgi:hypothetical protein